MWNVCIVCVAHKDVRDKKFVTSFGTLGVINKSIYAYISHTSTTTDGHRLSCGLGRVRGIQREQIPDI